MNPDFETASSLDGNPPSSSPRESFVQQAINFLQTSASNHLPLVQQLSYLEGKGLTPKEITEALKRSTISLRGGEPIIPEWAWTTISVLTAAFVGYTVFSSTAFMVDYFEDDTDLDDEVSQQQQPQPQHPVLNSNNSMYRNTFGEIDLLDDEEDDGEYTSDEYSYDPEESKPQKSQSMASALAKQTNTIEKAFQMLSKKIEDSMKNEPVWARQLQDEHKNLRREIDFIKQSIGITSQSPPLDPPQSLEDPFALLPTEVYLQTLSSSIDTLKQENSPEILISGINGLLMYITKLVENPEITRYHKLATNNQTFKSLLPPMKGYETVLKAVGFELSGMSYEWTWAKKNSANKKNIPKNEEAIRAIMATAVELLKNLKTESELKSKQSNSELS